MKRYIPRPWGDVPPLYDLAVYCGSIHIASRIRARMVARFQEVTK